MVFGRKKKERGLAALAGETVKFAKAQMLLDQTEAQLEKEIERDNQAPPKSKIGKARRKGEHWLHGRVFLLAIVLLNITDCILVLGELMLDIKYVTDLLYKAEQQSEEFLESMRAKHPVGLKDVADWDMDTLHSKLLSATIYWNDTGSTSGQPNTGNTVTPGGESHVRKRAADPATVLDERNVTVFIHAEKTREHTIEEDIAHALHKASITILAILVVETFFKIFCFGKIMLEHRLECFDAFVVIGSFIVDIVFIEGLASMDIQQFVLFLAFMVPWRVIRVVNSLVVAIMDHEHFRLKVLYKQKKKTSHDLKEAKDEIKGLEACVDALEKLCREAGVPDSHVKQKLQIFRKVAAKNNVVGAFSNFAIGGNMLGKPFQVGEHIEIKENGTVQRQPSPVMTRFTQGSVSAVVAIHDDNSTEAQKDNDDDGSKKRNGTLHT